MGYINIYYRVKPLIKTVESNFFQLVNEILRIKMVPKKYRQHYYYVIIHEDKKMNIVNVILCVHLS